MCPSNQYPQFILLFYYSQLLDFSLILPFRYPTLFITLLFLYSIILWLFQQIFQFIIKKNMQKTTNLTQMLLFLLANTTKASQIFIHLLTKKQLLNLAFLNHPLLAFLKNNHQIQNKIFYQTYLHLDQTSFYDFYYDSLYLSIQNQKLLYIFQNSQLNFFNQITVYQQIQYQLKNNIAHFVGQQKSRQITRNIFNIIKNPCLPLPKLRRQTVGAYCTSPLQIFIAQLNWLGRAEQNQQQEFLLDLKQQIIQKQGQIAQYFHAPQNQRFLLQLRYQTQNMCRNNYKQKQSYFINIILLILNLIDLQLSSIQMLLKAYLKTNNFYDLYVEFLVRYNSYRNSILQFEEKISFLFQHFNQTFQLAFPNYCTKPTFGLWRIMQKKWIQKMQVFHELNNKTYNYLIIKQGQNKMTEYIKNESQKQSESNDYPLFDHQIQYKMMKYKKNSEIYLSQNFSPFVQIQYFQKNQNYNTYLISDYTQYLVDISINQITVHWCGSTQQILGIYYMQMENALSDQNYEYLKYVYQQMQNLAVAKRIYEYHQDFLSLFLKPRTMRRINIQINEFLQDIKDITQEKYVNENNLFGGARLEYQCIQNWKVKEMQFEEIDEKINYLGNQRELDQNDVINHGMFFNLQQGVDLQVLQKIVKGNQEMDYSIGQTQDNTQSFISQESKKDGDMDIENQE